MQYEFKGYGASTAMIKSDGTFVPNSDPRQQIQADLTKMSLKMSKMSQAEYDEFRNQRIKTARGSVPSANEH